LAWSLMVSALYIKAFAPLCSLGASL